MQPIGSLVKLATFSLFFRLRICRVALLRAAFSICSLVVQTASVLPITGSMHPAPI